MTDRNEGNELIAKFMGLEKVTIGYYGEDDETQWQRDNEEWIEKQEIKSVGEYGVNVPENKWFLWEDMKYDSSWDWLMPIVEKIEQSGKFAFAIDFHPKTGNSILIHNAANYGITNLVIPTIEQKSKIEAVWIAVVEFIQWYNDHR